MGKFIFEYTKTSSSFVFLLLRFLPIVFTVALLSCGGRDKNRPEADLTILCTTDVHGQMLNYDFMKQKEGIESLSNVCTYAKNCREENPEGIILLDNGDLIQGCPSMYYYNIVDVRNEHLAGRVINYIGYDALNLGNHDLDGGEPVYYDHLKRDYKMPFLCANAIDNRTNEPMFDPYCIIERKGYKIAVLGLIIADVPQWLPISAVPHLRFISIMEATQQWLPIIESKEQPDLVVGLIHAGREAAVCQDSLGHDFEDGALPTARAVRGFDILLLGHDHLVMNDTIINNYGDTIHILQPAAHAKEIGRLDIHITPALKLNNHCRAEIRKQNLPLEEIETDADFNSTFADEVAKINSFLDRSIGHPIDSLDGLESLTGPSAIMDLIHSVQLSASYADISLASCMSNFTKIKEGELSMRQLFAIYKYENQMSKLWMTGEEIRKFLEFGYGRQFKQMTSADDHLLNFKLKANGDTIMGRFGPELVTPQYNFTSAAGINYEIDVRKPVGQRVRIMSMADGTPFNPERRYDVVMSSFQAAGGGGFLRQGLGWSTNEIERHTIITTVKDMRYYIQQYLKSINNGKKPPLLGSWQVVPTAWWKANKDRDAALLAPYIK